MRWTAAFVLVAAMGLAVAGFASAASGPKTPSATSVKGHFEYDLFDESAQMTFHFSCDEQRLVTSHLVRETIHCETTDTLHTRAVVFSPSNLFGGEFYWYSDFTGEQSTDFRLAGTPSGNLDGWATYSSAG